MNVLETNVTEEIVNQVKDIGSLNALARVSKLFNRVCKLKLESKIKELAKEFTKRKDKYLTVYRGLNEKIRHGPYTKTYDGKKIVRRKNYFYGVKHGEQQEYRHSMDFENERIRYGPERWLLYSTKIYSNGIDVTPTSSM